MRAKKQVCLTYLKVTSKYFNLREQKTVSQDLPAFVREKFYDYAHNKRYVIDVIQIGN